MCLSSPVSICVSFCYPPNSREQVFDMTTCLLSHFRCSNSPILPISLQRKIRIIVWLGVKKQMQCYLVR